MNKYVDALLILNALRFSEHNFTHYCRKTNALINYEVFRLTDNVLAALRPYLCFKNASTAHIAWMSLKCFLAHRGWNLSSPWIFTALLSNVLGSESAKKCSRDRDG